MESGLFDSPTNQSIKELYDVTEPKEKSLKKKREVKLTSKTSKKKEKYVASSMIYTESVALVALSFKEYVKESWKTIEER